MVKDLINSLNDANKLFLLKYMKNIVLFLIVVLFTSCQLKQNTQLKDTEMVKETQSEVKFINPNGVCSLLSSIGLNQGNFRLVESEGYSSKYLCDAYKTNQMTCSSSGVVCNELEYVAYGSKRGVTELNLKYRNYAGEEKSRENEKDIKAFITAANILTKATLGTELDELAKKQILETLTVAPQAGKIIYEKKVNQAVLSIFRSVNPAGVARVVELTIFADEYWKDEKNTSMEWGEK
jgi:hypothetical protein